MKLLNMCLCAVLLLCTLSCEKDDDCSGVECLPPNTRTGAGTFGCLVNGKPFVDNSGNFNCFYQFIDGEYYFVIGGRDDERIDQIVLGSQKAEIITNVNIPIKSFQEGNFYSSISFDCTNCSGASSTNENPGSLLFSKLDLQNNIVSALFEFTVTDQTDGTVYHITEGRFDSTFTQ